MTRVDKKHIEKRAESVFVRVIIDGFFSKIFFSSCLIMHLTSYWKQKQETSDKKNTSFEKKKEREKKFWSCEVFEMILLINARTNGIHQFYRTYLDDFLLLHIYYSGHLKLPHHEHIQWKNTMTTIEWNSYPLSTKIKF